MSRKILIVEDDPVARGIIHRALKTQDFDPIVVGDPIAALTQAQRMKPELIILDLGLPAGGGFTFLDRIRVFPTLATIPIIVVSGLDRATNEPRARQAGVVAYLEKPVQHDMILETVRAVLGTG